MQVDNIIRTRRIAVLNSILNNFLRLIGVDKIFPFTIFYPFLFLSFHLQSSFQTLPFVSNYELIFSFRVKVDESRKYLQLLKLLIIFLYNPKKFSILKKSISSNIFEFLHFFYFFD